jgi:hypothetical protein
MKLKILKIKPKVQSCKYTVLFAGSSIMINIITLFELLLFIRLEGPNWSIDFETYFELRRIGGVVRAIGRHHEVEVEKRGCRRAERRVDEVVGVPFEAFLAPVCAQARRLAQVHEHRHRLLQAVA